MLRGVGISEPLNTIAKDVGVGDAFGANGGHGAMTGVHLDCIVEWQHLGRDAVDQGFETAAGQVSTADAHLEEDISAEDLLAFPVVKGHMTGRMPWDEEGLQVCFTKSQHVSFLND